MQPTETMIDLQPILQGERIELRPLREDDFDTLFAVASDPLIWEQHPCNDRYQEPVFREFFREAMACRGAFAVIDRADGRIIGSSRYYGYDPIANEIEIGWSFLARSHWGGSYNREMKSLMLQHIFRYVQTAIFLVGPGNIRSQKAMEKIGGIRSGMRKNWRGMESILYRIEADSFKTSAGDCTSAAAVHASPPTDPG